MNKTHTVHLFIDGYVNEKKRQKTCALVIRWIEEIRLMFLFSLKIINCLGNF